MAMMHRLVLMKRWKHGDLALLFEKYTMNIGIMVVL